MSYVWDETEDDPFAKGKYDVRTVMLEGLASDYLTALNKLMPDFFQDTTATSQLMAYQFNDPCYYLQIDLNLTNHPALTSLTAGGKSTKPVSMPLRQTKSAAATATRPTPPPKRVTTEVEPSFPVPPHLDNAARAIRKHPLKVVNPPPNQHPIQPLPKFAKLISYPRPPLTSPTPDDPAPSPVLNYFFWSADVPGTPDNPGAIPMRADNVSQDIIFSIRIIDHADNFNLTSISITIPMGAPITKPSQNPGPLTQAYTGPGATMLSNLRFNPLVSNDTDTNSLVITLIPRSLQGFVELARQTELSFMLSSVVVNYSPKGPATVFVSPTISEIYTSQTQCPQQIPAPLMTLTMPSSKK